MSIDHMIRESHRLLQGLESGSMSGADAFQIADQTDPFILHMVFKYLREKYPAQNPNSQGIMTRLLELSSTYPEIVAKVKSGEKDLLNEWFNETYATSEFFADAEGLMDILVNKVEG